MVAVNYDWDEIEDNVDEEYDDAGTTVADYTTEPYLYGDLISQRCNGQSRFFCFDGLGSTIAVTDITGTVTDAYSYTAFGEVIEQAGTVNPFQYIGQKGYYSRNEGSECSVRRRNYVPKQGLWSSADPKSLVCEYVYALGRPTVRIDPSGAQILLPRLCLSQLRVLPGPNELGKLDCGTVPFQAWDFVVEFSADDPTKRAAAPCKGFIIQQVWWNCVVRDCDGKMLAAEDLHYYEAWPVEKDSSVSSVRLGRGKSDFAAYDPPLPSQGECHQHGEIRFYCQNAADDPRNDYGIAVGTGPLVGWAPGKFGASPCSVSTGELVSMRFPTPPPEQHPGGGLVEPSEPTRPPFWSPFYPWAPSKSLGSAPLAGPATRQFSMEWCCCKTRRDFVEASAYPSPREDPARSSKYLVPC